MVCLSWRALRKIHSFIKEKKNICTENLSATALSHDSRSSALSAMPKDRRGNAHGCDVSETLLVTMHDGFHAGRDSGS